MLDRGRIAIDTHQSFRSRRCLQYLSKRAKLETELHLNTVLENCDLRAVYEKECKALQVGGGRQLSLIDAKVYGYRL